MLNYQRVCCNMLRLVWPGLMYFGNTSCSKYHWMTAVDARRSLKMSSPMRRRSLHGEWSNGCSHSADSSKGIQKACDRCEKNHLQIAMANGDHGVPRPTISSRNGGTYPVQVLFNGMFVRKSDSFCQHPTLTM